MAPPRLTLDAMNIVSARVVEQGVSRTARFLVIFGCLVVSSIIVGGLIIWSMPDLCGNYIGKEVLSPDSKWKAVVFERDCGATTDFSTQISLINGNQSLPHGSSGNVFTADSGRDKVRVDVKGILPIDLNWESNNTLVVRYPARARVFTQVLQYKGVALRYVADEKLK